MGDVKFSTVEKVPGGKLVGVEAWVDGNKVSKVKIIGDFFLHPEEGISALEKTIVGQNVDFDSAQLEKDLSETAKENGLVLVGVTPGAIAGVLKKALTEGKQ